jgi:hypothetical protein
VTKKPNPTPTTYRRPSFNCAPSSATLLQAKSMVTSLATLPSAPRRRSGRAAGPCTGHLQEPPRHLQVVAEGFNSKAIGFNSIRKMTPHCRWRSGCSGCSSHYPSSPSPISSSRHSPWLPRPRCLPVLLHHLLRIQSNLIFITGVSCYFISGSISFMHPNCLMKCENGRNYLSICFLLKIVI